MLVSRRWLNRLVEIQDISSQDLAEHLTGVGHEVEAVTPLCPVEHLTIGQVLSCKDHPDSNHLHVTQVDIGLKTLQIVCGAPNVKEGQKVLVATVGTKLPAGLIEKASLRGVESEGMLCSLAELGLPDHSLSEEDHQGIYVLDPTAPVGDNAITYLGLDDDILDIKQTPNRADFLAMESIAREVSAIFNRPLHLSDKCAWDMKGQKTSFKVDSKTEKCPLFMARVIHNVDVKPSSLWIQNALRASGMNPINNIVDISNLVMLELGQPNHMYDYRFFQEPEITVVDDIDQELVTLDETSVHVKPGDVMITSGSQPIGIGGIKGLASSMIVKDTRDVVIEIASFDPVAINKTSKRLSILSEAAQRFSKPMNPQAPFLAMGRILRLLEEEAGLDLTKDVEALSIYDRRPQVEPIHISFTLDQMRACLGVDIAKDKVLEVLRALNLKPKVYQEKIEVEVPSYRQDLFIKEDIFEEIIRMVGYDVIESTLPLMPLTLGALNDRQAAIRSIEDILVGFGLNQVMTYSLVDQAKTQGGLGLKDPYQLLSPLSSNRAWMRNQLRDSMLDMLTYNLSHRQNNAGYFECSSVYGKDQEGLHLAIIGSGQLTLDPLTHASQKGSYRLIKGILESLVKSLGLDPMALHFEPNTLDDSLLHPYRSALVTYQKKVVGLLGELHPQLGIDHGYFMEVDAALLIEATKTQTRYQPVVKLPCENRDLALVCPASVTIQMIRNLVLEVGKPYISEVKLFDVYDLEDGKRSLAFRLIFNPVSGLTDEAVQPLMEKVLDQLEKVYQVTLRQ